MLSYTHTQYLMPKEHIVEESVSFARTVYVEKISMPT